MDALMQFKELQKQTWTGFAVLENFTGTCAPRLVRFAGIGRGTAVLDVGCGSGVVALTAARAGATVTGVDLTPELVAHARENASLAGLAIEWREGDVEELPFADGVFDAVVSQFGHMFAPRPEVAVGEMLRVLRPGGTVAFSTWPPELYTGRLFAMLGKYVLTPPPSGVPPSTQWGDPSVVRERPGRCRHRPRLRSRHALVAGVDAPARAPFQRAESPRHDEARADPRAQRSREARAIPHGVGRAHRPLLQGQSGAPGLPPLARGEALREIPALTTGRGR